MNKDYPAMYPGLFNEAMQRFDRSIDQFFQEEPHPAHPGCGESCATGHWVKWIIELPTRDKEALILDLFGYQAWLQVDDDEEVRDDA